MRLAPFAAGLAAFSLACASAPPPSSPSRPAAAERPAADSTPTISQRLKNLTRQDGFLPFAWDAKKGQLLLQVSRFREEFLYGSGFAGGAGIVDGSLDRGQQRGLAVCVFERVGPRVLLRQKQIVHRAGSADPEQRRAIEESFPSAVLASLPIVAEEGDAVLVDATAFLLSETDALAALRRARLGEWRADAARSAFNLDRTGAFPRNTEIEAFVTVTSDAPAPAAAAVLPDGRTMTLALHHTFLKLPEPGFTPRSLDPRVGFIPDRYFDHTAPITEPLEKYLAIRWRLVKKDPAAAVSEPVEPIVYYLDRGIPEPERSAIREGALWWNHAFEEGGFKNAFVLKDLPPGATFLDARYSGVEWVARAERSWSFGGSQVDPRTGEILHAVARIDSHRRRTTTRMWENTRRAETGGCDAADSPDLSFVAAGDPNLDERSLVQQRLAYLSAHEVGHTLGLMHNWAATTFGWGSVMDYLAPNIQVKNGALDLSDAYPKDIGSYDRFVIRWGYTPDGDPKRLDAIVRDAYAHGIYYPLESDPRWVEYDFGADPVKWLATTQAVRRAILERFGPAQLAPGEWLFDLQQRFNLAYLYHRFGIQAAQQFVGGQYAANAVAGDGQTPVAWVPPGKQREALDLLLGALEPGNLDIPDRILAALVPPPAGTRHSQEQFPSEAGETFSLWSAARSLARLIVDPLLDPERAARLTLAAGRDALTLDAVIERLVARTWGAPPDGDPRQAALRRVAQRVVLDRLLDVASRETSPEVRSVVEARLLRLKSDLRARRGSDAVADAHLRAAERDITDFFEHPELRKPRPDRPYAPPGRPIGADAPQPRG
jgi:hypothetical protein